MDVKQQISDSGKGGNQSPARRTGEVEGQRYTIREGSTILMDVDDTCLNWYHAFQKYCESLGMDPIFYPSFQGGADRYHCPTTNINLFEAIKNFNKSYDWMSSLEPINNSEKVLPDLMRYCDVHFVTACGDHPNTLKARVKNLHDVFGSHYSDLVIMTLGGHKNEIFKSFDHIDDVIVFEDSLRQIDAGLNAGHQVFAHKMPWNDHIDHVDVIHDWRQITIS